MKQMVAGVILGIILGLSAAVAWSGYHLIKEAESSPDLFWE